MPPFVDVEITIWLTPPVNRASSHTTYNWPVRGSIATNGSSSDVRNWAPVFGSTSLATCSLETVVGPDHVAPPSADDMKPTLMPRGVKFGDPVVWKSAKKS